ncbi:adaptor protein MecA [Fervidibacillus halotolerans]|uniref:Adapter protein MecA n=1 Tax=Fervidibacillus halotolerans TaxID=2980027 RepID=A0A9E8M0Q5_9BACI|nr:adaptor protein MecA [Fervidibacillus halotolerans]WAA13069.1 adaptor protein MecA [Fervidibacillus halotolerans]
MEIERINENTVKFFISYVDVEERGFDREEIWYNREKSEELFWEMMDEVHEEEGFVFDGPLWIQVQALEKGLEVLVTKAQISKDGSRFELPFSEEKLKDFSLDEQIEKYLDQHFFENSLDSTESEENETVSFVTYFQDLEDLISLSKRSLPEGIQSRLFSMDQKYYLYTEYSFKHFSEEEVDNMISIILEYGVESGRTLEVLEEYGNEIIKENVFDVLKQYFN